MGQHDTLRNVIRNARVNFAYDLVRHCLQLVADDLDMGVTIDHDHISTCGRSTTGYLVYNDLAYCVDVTLGPEDHPYPVNVNVQLFDSDLQNQICSEDCGFDATDRISIVAITWLGTARKWLKKPQPVE